MSAALLETSGWSRSQWAGAVSLLVLLHVVGLFILSERKTTERFTGLRPSNIYFVGDPGADSRLAEWLSLQDPMLFVQIDPQSISQSNLLATSRFSYELTNWTEPFRWLAPSDQYFADDFNLYVTNAVRPSTRLTEKMPPVLSEVANAPPIMPMQAVLSVEGELEGRRLISKHPLPANESSITLTNTVVTVRVDSAGETLSAALISGSGFPKADQAALAFARQARFERLIKPGNGSSRTNANDRGLAFGQLVFQWFPGGASATNQLTARP